MSDMRALMLTDYKKFEMTDIPEPSAGQDDVVIRIRACGICGSDVHGFDGSSGRRIPPLVMGHEAAGVVERVGKGVRQLNEGDRVTFDSMISCGHCEFCRRGKINLCDARRVLGVSCGDYRQHGAFAELVSVPQHIVVPIPDDLSFEQAALVEPVSIAVHAINLTPLELGQSAVVVGCGTIGLLCVQALRAAGCGAIYATDPDETRRERALQAGADDVFDPRSVDLRSVVAARTGGYGADIAIEAVGATEPVRSAIDVVRKGGVVTLVGNVTADIDFPLQLVVTREIQLVGSCGSSGEYAQCLELMSRRIIDVEPLVTATAPLADGASWFDRLYAQEPGLLKVILQP